MNDLTHIPPDSLFLTEEERVKVPRMAALGYCPEDIAIYIGLRESHIHSFVLDAGIPGTTVWGLIREGRLYSRAKPEMKLHEAAESGDIDAIKQLAAVREQRVFEELLKDMDEYE